MCDLRCYSIGGMIPLTHSTSKSIDLTIFFVWIHKKMNIHKNTVDCEKFVSQAIVLLPFFVVEFYEWRLICDIVNFFLSIESPKDWNDIVIMAIVCTLEMLDVC